MEPQSVLHNREGSNGHEQDNNGFGCASVASVSGNLYGCGQCEGGGQELIVDQIFIEVVPGNSSTVDRGQMEYTEAVIFRE